RRINDGMGVYIAQQTLKALVAGGRAANRSQVAILGLTFKENCPDLRNSKVIDLIRELESFGARVTVADPRASAEQAQAEYGIALADWKTLPLVDAVILAVAHKEFLACPLDEFLARVSPGGLVVDVKSVLDKAAVEGRGLTY